MSQTNTETTRPVKREESKGAWIWKEMKKNKTAYFMLAPFFILFIIFTVLPVFLSIILSLTDFNMLQMPHWLGLKNFTRLFLEDEIFMLACQNTLVFACTLDFLICFNGYFTVCSAEHYFMLGFLEAIVTYRGFYVFQNA